LRRSPAARQIAVLDAAIDAIASIAAIEPTGAVPRTTLGEGGMREGKQEQREAEEKCPRAAKSVKKPVYLLEYAHGISPQATFVPARFLNGKKAQ
jgi:hypothetical protein